MHRLFLQLTLWLSLGTVLICGIVLFSVSWVTDLRERQYFEKVLTLPMQLLKEGVSRHAARPERQQQWLASAGRILSGELTLQPRADSDRLRVDRDTESLSVTVPLDTDQQLQLQVSGWGAPQWHATLFLILNEFGRVPPTQQEDALFRLSTQAPYDLSVIERAGVRLNPRYQKLLAQGQTVMELRQRPGESAALQFFAPFGETEYLLSLGPVDVFEPYPYHVLLLAGGGAAILSMLLAILMSRPMVRQLRAIEHELDQIEPNQLQANLSFAERTPFDQLANKISAMTERIDSLVKLQRETVGAISHDLRTPISRLRLRAEMIRRHLPEGQRYRVDALEDDLGDLRQLADEVVRYISLHRDTDDDADQQTELVPSLRRLLVDSQAMHPQTHWRIDLPDMPLVAPLSESLLHRLMNNLLTNAVRYGRGEVWVGLREGEDHTCVLSVDDDGPGIPVSQRERVLEPFWRADDARQRETGGHGLGLAIVKRIVERVGGGIALLDSPQLGGARFQVTLPVLQQPAYKVET